jgi:trans-2-enoyl-CoA reductase
MVVTKERLPQDTENTIYIEEWEIDTIQDIVDRCREKWDEIDNSKLDKLDIQFEEIQTKCFGYDQYDPSDYRKYYVVTKK